MDEGREEEISENERESVRGCFETKGTKRGWELTLGDSRSGRSILILISGEGRNRGEGGSDAWVKKERASSQ